MTLWCKCGAELEIEFVKGENYLFARCPDCDYKDVIDPLSLIMGTHPVVGQLHVKDEGLGHIAKRLIEGA